MLTVAVSKQHKLSENSFSHSGMVGGHTFTSFGHKWIFKTNCPLFRNLKVTTTDFYCKEIMWLQLSVIM